MATFTMKGLLQGTADLRDLTQYEYAKPTVLLKHLFHCYHQVNWLLDRLRNISYPSLVEVKKKAYITVLGTDYDHIDTLSAKYCNETLRVYFIVHALIMSTWQYPTALHCIAS